MRKNLKSKKNIKNSSSGITLITLVVTIIVLFILSGVTLNVAFGDDGVLKQSRGIQNKTNNMIQSQEAELNVLVEDLNETMNPTVKGKILTSDIRITTDSPTVIAKDAKGNQVVVPGGFKVSEKDSGDSVEQGIVIEDKDGNQFVWIPVSNINGDGSNKIIKDDGTEVEITLGRYTFATSSPGTPTLIQPGSEYDQTTIANVANGTVDTKYRAGSYYYELSDSRISNEESGTTGTNTTAKNLADFISKTNTNKGFYIARYEASYGGTDSQGNDIPLSKVSTNKTTSSWTKSNSTIGTLWNYLTQPQAAIVSQNMYKNNNYVESDLINSYAWDTAIVYIQAMGNENYANATRGTNTSLMNTGTTEDQKCKIFDMAVNEFEWTTECSFGVSSSRAYPCTCRGGYYSNSGSYTSFRKYNDATGRIYYVSFRPLLYVK